MTAWLRGLLRGDAELIAQVPVRSRPGPFTFSRLSKVRPPNWWPSLPTAMPLPARLPMKHQLDESDHISPWAQSGTTLR